MLHSARHKPWKKSIITIINDHYGDLNQNLRFSIYYSIPFKMDILKRYLQCLQILWPYKFYLIAILFFSSIFQNQAIALKACLTANKSKLFHQHASWTWISLHLSYIKENKNQRKQKACQKLKNHWKIFD